MLACESLPWATVCIQRWAKLHSHCPWMSWQRSAQEIWRELRLRESLQPGEAEITWRERKSGGASVRRGQCTCILAADVDGAASCRWCSLSVGPRTTLQDLGVFLRGHMVPSSLQGPDNTGEVTEGFLFVISFRIVDAIKRNDRMEKVQPAALTQLLKARWALLHQGPKMGFREGLSQQQSIVLISEYPRQGTNRRDHRFV